MAKTYNNFYSQIYSWNNLILAWKKARKGKTKKAYVIEFESNLPNNLKELQKELIDITYKPAPLVSFIIQDPKTRKISKSAFRDRIIHHAIILVIEPIFNKLFIYDSCANIKGRGNLFALKRLEIFIKKVSRNGKLHGWFNKNQIKGYCFKADIKHYFEEVKHEILLKILQRKIVDKKVIWLIEQILSNLPAGKLNGMPLGNLTSQFFANVYLNELDYFIKYKLGAKYYLRYVDDFIILHESKRQLEIWKAEICIFLKEVLILDLHPQKSKIFSLSRGIDFVGFRIFWYYKLLRKRNIRKIFLKFEQYKKCELSREKILETFNGWNAYSKWANSYGIRKNLAIELNNYSSLNF